MTKFPVNFPISREVDPETGSTMTGSSANEIGSIIARSLGRLASTAASSLKADVRS